MRRSALFQYLRRDNHRSGSNRDDDDDGDSSDRGFNNEGSQTDDDSKINSDRDNNHKNNPTSSFSQVNTDNNNNNNNNNKGNLKFCPLCVNDNDARVLYRPGENWFLNTSSEDAFGGTIHLTSLPNSTVAIAFNGSSIIVFGTIAAGNGTAPKATYTIDADPPFPTTQPLADRHITNQPLFASHGLSGEQHLLTISVDDVQSEIPYMLDYFTVFPTAKDKGSSSLTSPAPLSTSSLDPTPSAVNTVGRTSLNPIMIALTTIVSVMLLAILLTLGGWCFLRSRRRRRPQETPEDPSEPFETKSRLGTLFTTTESILQPRDWPGYTPSKSSVYYPRSIRSEPAAPLSPPPRTKSLM